MRHAPRGWYCKIERDGRFPHYGSCPLVPAWWNLKWRWFMHADQSLFDPRRKVPK